MYDYLIVGAGLFGSVFAHEAARAGKKVLVIDKRNNIAGNVYTEKMEGINVHVYGAHIFILIIRRCGSTFRSLLHLTDSLIHLLLIIRGNCIHCHLICIPSIRCGAL